MKDVTENKNYSIEIDDGFVEVEVKNQFGEHVGAVRINPGDINIIAREEKAEENIKKILEEVRDTAAETEEDEEVIEKKLLQLDAEIKEQIDILFDYKVSDTVFKNQHCLAVSQGKFYIERLLEAFEPVIAEIVKKETEESQKRMDKYLNKYTPQDHKKKGQR
ncbi:MAG: hypothetical protein NC293_10100 [Roseburia sp.]|nr:hypothetical protein [Roseburia sp.]